MPPDNVRVAHARCASWLAEQQKPASPAMTAPHISAIDRFKQTVRQDDPPEMPAWSRDRALAGNQSQPSERAADKFRRQRLAQDEKGNSNAK
jgi:hypothetical protein